MSNVYFHEISNQKTEETSKIASKLLENFFNDKKIKLNTTIPLKVHFGEKRNKTFIKSDNYLGIIEYLQKHSIKTFYIETNALYAGKRLNKKDHIQTAKEHGFTQLPIVIADGEKGNEVAEVEINKKHFKKCKIGKAFSEHQQFIVISHFKGHRLAGFGGAIKQLAMGFGSRAGKMDQHANSKPIIIPFLCKKCGACIRYCPENAIKMGIIKPKIDSKKCIGCAGCISVCKKNAIAPNLFKSFSGDFKERIAEYALAGHMNKKNIYINFALNITKGCDCEGHEMKPITNDLGIFVSDDPVAIDQACLDLLQRKTGKKLFKSGKKTLDYAEKIELGNTKYKLKEYNLIS
jgi:uncharacterized Fe-S center protein